MNLKTDHQKLLLIGLALVLITTAVFWPIARHDFINYDDPDYVTENQVVKEGLAGSGIKWAFTTGHASNWHPVTWLSHMMDVALFGLNPGGHHLMNVGFHIANTLLLLLFLHQTTGAIWRGALVAALFALHPLHVESVAWVSERKDVLSTFFGLLTLMAYAAYAKSRVEGRVARTKYAAALVLFALGLMSKPMLVTWPFVMLLLDFWPLGRVNGDSWRATGTTWRRLLWEKIPFVALTATSCAITFLVQQQGGAVTTVENLPATDRIENAIVSYVNYLGKTVWPSNLAIFYPHPELRFPTSQQWPVELIVLIGLGLAALSVAIFRRARQYPHLFTGWFWYVGTLVPVIGIVQVGTQAMADRYSYVPLIGVFIAMAWSVQTLQARLKWPSWAWPAGSIALLVICLKLSHQQVATWKNDFTVFGHALAVTEGNAPAHSTLGKAWGKQGDFNKALEHLTAAREADPNYPNVYYDIGLTLTYLGRYSEAIEQYRIELARKPTHLMARNNLAAAYTFMGKNEEAISEYRALLELNPEHTQGHHGLGLTLATLGRLTEAEAHLAKALALDQDFAPAKADLAKVLAANGRLTEAEQLLSSVQDINSRPELLVVLANILMESSQTNRGKVMFAEIAKQVPALSDRYHAEGKRYQSQGNGSAAQAAFTTAVRLAPTSAAILSDWGSLHAQMGNMDQAVACFTKVIELSPSATAFHHLALSYASQSKYPEAISNYEAAIKHEPNFLDSLNNLAWILATHPDSKFRNGIRAVELAEKACQQSNRGQPMILGTLAAAYAEAGRFDEAIRTGNEARTLAETHGLTDLAARNAELIQKYQRHQPHRE